MRIFIVLLAILISSGEALAACGGSSPNLTVADATYAEVAACVAVATYGDTITISDTTPRTWSSQLAITKGIKIVGPGSASLTITSGYSGYLITYTPDATTLSNANTFELSGITWALGGAGNQWIDFINATNTAAKVRIYGNAITGAGTTSKPFLKVDGYFTGVVYSNTCVGTTGTNTCHMDLYGRDSAADWQNLTYAYGSADNLYFEDNTFDGYDTFSTLGHGGRVVLRYNSYIYRHASQDLYPWFDIHGNQPAGVYAPIAAEVYGNSLTQITARAGLMTAQRGGKALIFYNQATGTASTFPAYAREEYDDTISLPATNSIDGQPQHVSNSYYWANFKGDGTSTVAWSTNPTGDNGYGCCELTTVGVCDTSCTAENGIAENRDWWQTNASFDGTVGVGCGTLASRPETCTTGVGYWATAQSCSDLTGMVGASPAAPIAGTLYKCTATNTWTAYYTPYSYPHPLRGETTTRTVTSSKVGTGGTLSYEGESVVNDGDNSQIYTQTPQNGYRGTWSGTCGATGTGSTYQKTNVTADCTVVVTFDTIKIGGVK